MTDIFQLLRAPFSPRAIHWRAQNVSDRNGGSALALAYIDARDVQDRLDEVVGPAHWRDSYTETPKGRLICTLEIRVDGEWISKSDGAGDTDVEGEKGAISDALKRAAVKWGIGRYLYDIGNIWAPCETKTGNNNRLQWVKWKPEADRVFERALAKAAPLTDSAPQTAKNTPAGPINNTTRDWLSGEIDKRQIPIAEFCSAHGVDSLKAMTYERLNEARAWINSYKKAA